jgi:hypothetical protein
MNAPNEIWYALGGLVAAVLLQRLGLPTGLSAGLPKKPIDLRQTIREVLIDILQIPQPAPVRAPVPDDEEIRQRLRNFTK